MNAADFVARLDRNVQRVYSHEDSLAEVVEAVLEAEARKVARAFRAKASQRSLVSAAPSSAAAMVALYPTEEQQATLAQPGGDPPEILHLTLAFLGEIDPDRAEEAYAAMREVAARFGPLEGVVAGVGTFKSSTSPLDEIARAAELVAPDGGYGETAYNRETRTVYWVCADWTSDEEHDVAEQAFLAIGGVEAWEHDAETGLPSGDDWTPVYAGGRRLVAPSYPSIVLPDVPALPDLREAVTSALDAAGIDYSRVHGFVPHITIAYTEEPSPPPEDLLGLPLTFNGLWVARGDRPREIPFGEGTIVAAGPPSDWTPPHPDELFDAEGFVKTLRTKSDPVRRAAIAELGKGLPISWDVTNPLVGNVLSRSGSKVTNVAQTTRLSILRVVREAYEQGLSIPDTAEAIQAAMGGASKARASLIARTELASVANGGSLAATQTFEKAAGVKMWKVWRTAPGAEFPRHEQYLGLDGQTVGLSDYFTVGTSRLQYPGDPAGPIGEIARCRCTCTYQESAAPAALDPARAPRPAAPKEGDLRSQIRHLSHLDSLPVSRLWQEMARNGKIENLARKDIATEETDRLAAQAWRRKDEGLPEGTVRHSDLAGEQHLHSVYSDGHNTIREMAEEARERGQTQMVVSDHAHLMTPESIARQHAEIDALNAEYEGRFRVLKGIEANILEDGSLDLTAEQLSAFDVVNAGLHHRPDFNATARLEAAARNEHVTTIAHPHSAVGVDYDRLAKTAARENVALEINGRDMLRKDTQKQAEAMIRAALEHRVPLQIGSDAHRTGNLVDTLYAVRFAAERGVRADNLLPMQTRAEGLVPPPGDVFSVPTAPFLSKHAVSRIDELGLDGWPPKKGQAAQRLLGDALDTEQVYSKGGVWSAERAKLHEEIADSFFEGKAAATGQRRAFFTAGGGASGKGNASFLLEGKELTLEELAARRDFVVVDPDAVKALLPEYQKMTRAGDAYASLAVHEESSAISRAIIDRAQAEGFSVVIDTTGSSSRFVQKLDRFAGDGYDVQVTMFSAPTNSAIERSIARGEQTGRYVALAPMKAAHQGASRNLLEWQDSLSVRSWRVYDNTGAEPKLVAEGGSGRVVVRDESSYRAILAKADEGYYATPESIVRAEPGNIRPTSTVQNVTSDLDPSKKLVDAALSTVDERLALPPEMASAGKIKVEGNLTLRGRPVDGYFDPKGSEIHVGRITTVGPYATTAHEYGHFVDWQGFGAGRDYASLFAVEEGEMSPWYSAVRTSPTARKLQSAHAKAEDDALVGIEDETGFKHFYTRFEIAYAIDPRELWARSFVQWLSLRDERLAEHVARELKGKQSVGTWYWPTDEFAPIAKAMDDLFESKGWLLDDGA